MLPSSAIIISDGEDHNQLAFESAKKAKDLGVKIFTLGVGSDKGSPIPIRTNGVIESYKKNTFLKISWILLFVLSLPNYER